MLQGIDISNLQGPPSAYRDQVWYKNAQFVIVQAIAPPYSYPGWDHVDAVTGVRGYTGEQLTAAREDGKFISVYTFLFHAGFNVRNDTLARLSCVPQGMRLDFRTWVDEEDEKPYAPQSRQQELAAALAAHDEWCSNNQPHLPPAGGYSRDQYIADFLDSWWPDGRVYWQANYSAGSNPELLPMRPIVQYTSTPVDTDAMLESEIVVATDPSDPAWVAKKPLVVQWAGELVDLANQMDAELNRPQTPRKRVLRPISQGVRDRANSILA